jgi:uncharacterized protein (DUF2237 family)
MRMSEFPRSLVFMENKKSGGPKFSTARECDFAYRSLMPSNVLGGNLQCCCENPATGFYRDGFCKTGPGDLGLHTVCAIMTPEFLEFSFSRGNDLITPRPEIGFKGLEPGDRWCLCVSRWKEALEAGTAPPVILEATHASTIEFVSLDDLMTHAADID